MEFAKRHASPVGTDRGAGAHPRCPQCREEALVLQRRHVSPARLGTPVVTEYYDCDYCDASYQFSPASQQWKPVYT